MTHAAFDPRHPRTRRRASQGGGTPGASWRSSAPWISGFLTLGAIVLIVVHLGTLEEFTRLVVALRPAWFLLALMAQAATYVSASVAWARTLRFAGHPRPLSLLVPLGVAKLFTDQVVPTGGVSGAILVTRALARRGVPTHAAMAVLLVGLVSYFAAYLLAVVIGLGILWLHHRANVGLLAVVGVFIVIVVAIPWGVLWMKAKGPRLLARWVKRLPGAAQLLRSIADAPTGLVRDVRLLVQTTSLELLIFALDSLTLWLVLRGLGQDPPLWVAFVSFVMASMAATLGPIPLGLGTFEAANIGMLHHLGIIIEAALAATLILRGLTFWLPMLPGLYLARREIGPK
ncbi:MAG TPA: lysylphosphatidylglycerol synthase transmembrane domain-containing protein [Stellaceae bacterium]|nr:lysylphosphatidylglycerol synthase transmembrane domain-containing protein [Stellaceae bacterium]